MAKVIKIIQPPIDYSMMAPYVHQWVALTPDRKKVMAADKNFKKLSKKLDKMGVPMEKAILHFVLDFNRQYSF